MVDRSIRIIQAVVAAIAVLFGALTVFAGGRVLLGADPGYEVFRPLLVYNTVMGFVYIAGGLIAWRNLRPGRNVAAGIFILNLAILFVVFLLYWAGGEIAAESLRAMTLRSAVWLAFFTTLWWTERKSCPTDG